MDVNKLLKGFSGDRKYNVKKRIYNFNETA